MQILWTVIVTFFAGMGAGLGTGFAGMSAAAVISPMLITFLGMDPYMAVGIALSSDVLASAVSAYVYGKNRNLDIKNGVIMMISVLTFTVVGSYVSSLDGELFSIHDLPSWNQIYCKTGHDNEREHAECISKETCNSVNRVWSSDWIYLWIYRSRWWNDDVADFDICAWI